MRLPAALLRLALVFLALAGGAAQAADPRAPQPGPVPDWVETAALPTAGTLPESSVGRHYLLIDSQTHVAQRAKYRRNAYRIVSEAGLQYGAQINLSYDPSYEKIVLHHVRLIRDGQTIDKLEPERIQVFQQERDLQRLLYNGQLSAHLILEDVRVGDTVDLAYTVHGTNPVFGDHFVDSITLGWGIPVSQLRHKVICPATGRRVFHRVAGTSPARLEERTTALGRELVWEARDLPEVVFDGNAPWWHETYAYVQLTDFPDWKSVVDWALPLYPLDGPAPPELKAKAASLLAATGPDLPSRVVAALEFVQDEIRYLGIEMGTGSHRPSAPETVFSRRFGDCKDKAYLLCRLLREMDVHAVPLLVHSSNRHTMLNWLPSPHAFDHVVVLVRVGAQYHIVDPTLLHQARNLNDQDTRLYGPGLPVEPGTTALLDPPASAFDVATTRVEEEFVLPALDQPATMVVRTTFTRRAAENMRDLLAESTREELGKKYLDFYAHYYPDITADGPPTWTDDRKQNRVVVEERYRIKELFARTAGSRVRKASFNPSAFNEYTESVGAAGRTAPLSVSHPVELSTRTIVQLPEPWPLKPETLAVDDTGFRYERTIGGQPARLEFNYSWKSKADHVKAADFVAHARNLARVRDSFGYELTYTEAGESGGGAGSAGGFRVNWVMASFAVGLAAVLFALYLCALFFWPRNPEPPVLPLSQRDRDLTGLGGWLILVAIGVVLRPCVLLYQLSDGFSVYFDLAAWEAATAAGTDTHRPYYAFILPVELALHLTLFALACLVPVPFFMRRRGFPGLMMAMLGLQLLASVFSVWSVSALGDVAEADRAEYYVALLQATIHAAIWIPYFALSRRVRLTFTR